MRLLWRGILLFLGLFVAASTLTAIAATNTVPLTKADDETISFQINHLRPSACAGLTLSHLVTGTGFITGTEGNDLILSSSMLDTIDGLGGDDCIVTGGGDDILVGGGGSDICIGGDGSDTFLDCESVIQ